MRLGDLDELKQRMCEICNRDYSDEPCDPSDCVFCNAIKDSPTIDAVPVARCRECAHKNTTACPAYDAPFNRTSLRIKFCSEGQRKEAAHEVSEPCDGGNYDPCRSGENPLQTRWTMQNL